MTDVVIAIVGGAVAGMINTLAGNGSAITLTILTELLGLPPNVANGTNRIGILAQSITGTYEFVKRGKLVREKVLAVIVPFMPGALAGVIVATKISNEAFKEVFGILLILLLVVILVKPKRWLKPGATNVYVTRWLRYPLFFILGFYGGFIQMGMGIFFLATMVLVMRYSLTHSNAVKLLVVGAYTTFVLAIFHWQGLVDWKMGSIVAVGQASGGWITARYAAKYEWMEKVTYYLLVVIIFLAILYFYDIVNL